MSDELHGFGPCGLCGKDPASGYASEWVGATDVQTWFCHGDDDESPTCYERRNWVEAHTTLEEFARELGVDLS